MNDADELTADEKGAILSFIFHSRPLNKTRFSNIPNGDQENLNWLDQWGTVLQDSWNDFIDSQDLKGKVDSVLRDKIKTGTEMDIHEATFRVMDRLTGLFHKDYQDIQDQREHYKQMESFNTEKLYVGYFDDFMHLMGVMMTGCCTWDVRDKQVEDSSAHFGTISLQNAEGRLLGKSQIQLLRVGIKDFSDPKAKSTRGWKVLSVIADNISKEEFGISKYQAFISMLRLAQDLAKKNGMQSATLTVAPVMHAQGEPEHGFVKDLVQKNWLIPVKLEQEIYVAKKTSEHGEYKYQDVYMIQIPDDEINLEEVATEAHPKNSKADKDYAMHSINNQDEANRGGIDLTSEKVLSVQNDGQAIQFHIDPATFRQVQNAPGFTSVIINIQPMNNLRIFLGITDSQPAQQKTQL